MVLTRKYATIMDMCFNMWLFLILQSYPGVWMVVRAREGEMGVVHNYSAKIGEMVMAVRNFAYICGTIECQFLI